MNKMIYFSLSFSLLSPSLSLPLSLLSLSLSLCLSLSHTHTHTHSPLCKSYSHSSSQLSYSMPDTMPVKHPASFSPFKKPVPKTTEICFVDFPFGKTSRQCMSKANSERTACLRSSDSASTEQETFYNNPTGWTRITVDTLLHVMVADVQARIISSQHPGDL